MKKIILALSLILSACGLCAESKILYENKRGLSYLYLYEFTTEETIYYKIYASELATTDSENILEIRCYDKQKISDVLEYLLNNDGMKGLFLSNMNNLELKYNNIILKDKTTDYYDTFPKIRTTYTFFVE